MIEVDELLSMGLEEAKFALQDAVLHVDDIDRQILNLRKLKVGYLADVRDLEQHINVLKQDTGLERDW